MADEPAIFEKWIEVWPIKPIVRIEVGRDVSNFSPTWQGAWVPLDHGAEDSQHDNDISSTVRRPSRDH